ncbi:MAG: hypothetical protein DRQ78_04575, partial [Epsilonproteobacteria bacterium]
GEKASQGYVTIFATKSGSRYYLLGEHVVSFSDKTTDSSPKLYSPNLAGPYWGTIWGGDQGYLPYTVYIIQFNFTMDGFFNYLDLSGDREIQITNQIFRVGNYDIRNIKYPTAKNVNNVDDRFVYGNSQMLFINSDDPGNGTTLNTRTNGRTTISAGGKVIIDTDFGGGITPIVGEKIKLTNPSTGTFIINTGLNSGEMGLFILYMNLWSGSGLVRIYPHRISTIIAEGQPNEWLFGKSDRHDDAQSDYYEYITCRFTRLENGNIELYIYGGIDSTPKLYLLGEVSYQWTKLI